MTRKKLPFQIDTTDELCKWRIATFWEKEPETINWLERMSEVGAARTLLDVGANIGLFSLYWLSLNPENLVIACEPNMQNTVILEKNMALNNFQDRFQLETRPLSLISSLEHYAIEDERVGASSFKLAGVDNKLNSAYQAYTTTSINEILSDRNAKCILKIDTDGTDFDILRGGNIQLENEMINSILIEASENDHSLIESFLNSYNFKIDEILNNLPNHSDIRRIKSGKYERNRIYSNLF